MTTAKKSALPAHFTYTAHTGCMETEDNSLESITAGAQYGADIVEIDLFFTEDGTPVLSHDAPKGNEVTLEQAFKKVSEYDTLRVNVDVKVCTALEKVKQLAEQYGIKDRIFFTGLFENDIPTAKAACPNVPYWLNVDVRPKLLHTQKYLQSLVAKVRDCGAVGINMNENNATKELVDAFHANGLDVSLWTVNEVDDMKKAIEMSPDNITTRRPDLLHDVLKEV